MITRRTNKNMSIRGIHKEPTKNNNNKNQQKQRKKINEQQQKPKESKCKNN